jgi:hypothetical protein
MISNNYELYESIGSLSQKLRSFGEERWSSLLDDALSISSLPGEILGEIRLQLFNLCDTEIPARLELKAQIDESLSYLDKVLGPSRANDQNHA